jgi:hypothetical protein
MYFGYYEPTIHLVNCNVKPIELHSSGDLVALILKGNQNITWEKKNVEIITSPPCHLWSVTL